jgi:selenide,water dikinase
MTVPGATVRLTAFSRGAGCGCKLPASELHQLLADLPGLVDERVLVDFRSADDAAVVKIAPNLALVQTVDFFTPIVDDARDFGAIAAANALSDVYAMGGNPLSALSIVAFPIEHLGAGTLRLIVSGAVEVLSSAGVSLVGGHSIDDPEPKFGLAVTGLIDPGRVLSNRGALPGDVLVLTKPLGTGVIATQAKHGAVALEDLAEAVGMMRQLNDVASRQALDAGARAGTDVTGFGLLGHAYGIARESQVAITLDASLVPALPAARELLARGLGISGGTSRNADWAAGYTTFDAEVPDCERWLLSDATTSGGLLVVVPSGQKREVDGAIIGRVVDGPAGTIHVQ